MERSKKLLESLENKTKSQKVAARRYNLSEIISESYKALYSCEKGSNLYRLAEAHIADVRENPTQIDRLSRQLCNLKHLSKMVESKEMDDAELLVPEEKHTPVVPKEEKKEEIKESEELDEASDTDPELTDEELEELTKYLADIRKEKKIKEASEEDPDAEEAPVEESAEEEPGEEKTYESLDLSEFSKKSAGKAFVKTFKKLDSKLKEGTALTRQESISLYKATNSAMTQLSVELEKNPEFLPVFTESVTLLSADVDKLLEAMKQGKAPSKSTMKSLAKFSEAILREEDEEELPPVEDEETEMIPGEEEAQLSEEEEEFLQDYADAYADAREEIHAELEDRYGDSEDPGVQARLENDAAEVAILRGEDEGEEEAPEEEPVEDEGETPEEEPADVEENVEPADAETPADVDESDDDITDDELAELKKHLTEMRRAKQIKESGGRKLMRRK